MPFDARNLRWERRLRGEGGRVLTFAFVAALCACGGAAPEARGPVARSGPRAAAPRLVGRFDRSDPAAPKVRWSGSTIEVRFSGSGITMRLRVPPPPARAGEHPPRVDPPLYSVRLDDGPPRVLPVETGDLRYVLAAGLDPGRSHVVVVTRESEAFAGEHQLLGFELPPGGELLPSVGVRRLRIAVVGDSITCGYGVLGRGPDCRFSFATERASAAYGALLSRALDAEVTTMCWSGKGVYRNYDEPDAPTMAEIWTPDDSAPDAVVVMLGTNDVLAPRSPFDAALFEGAYEALLARVRAAHPAPWIFLPDSPMLDGAARDLLRASLARVVARRRSDGDVRIERVELPAQGDRVGCDSHPDAAMQAVIADELERALRARIGR